MRSMTPIRSATRAAGPRTSTGLPLERTAAARSTTVTRKPWRDSQYARVHPAMPPPEINTVLLLIGFVLRGYPGL